MFRMVAASGAGFGRRMPSRRSVAGWNAGEGSERGWGALVWGGNDPATTMRYSARRLARRLPERVPCEPYW